MSEQENVEVARLQNDIEEYLNPGSTSIIFNYGETDGRVRLDVVTVNPRHNQSFLFHTTAGYDKVDVLRKMLDYIKTSRDKDNTYTIQWTIRGEDELQTSYFRAKNIPEAIDKLHYGRDPNGITIFSVVMNPIT